MCELQMEHGILELVSLHYQIVNKIMDMELINKNIWKRMSKIFGQECDNIPRRPITPPKAIM